jgi:hypothetical protein
MGKTADFVHRFVGRNAVFERLLNPHMAITNLGFTPESTNVHATFRSRVTTHIRNKKTINLAVRMLPGHDTFKITHNL